MQVTESLVDRKQWPEGPWDREPDLVTDGPLLYYRLANGTWSALVGVESALKDRAVMLQKIQPNFHGRRIEIISFDDDSEISGYIDTNKIYLGIFFQEWEDTRPREMKYLDDLPDYIREHIGAAWPTYVTLEMAQNHGAQLAEFLRNKGFLTEAVDCAPQRAHV